ncbi:MAG: hypothetical protein LV468_00410 [Candidatus Nitrosotenuis sp.]|nr:hypothetical protein [Candidatus Nitrosotenuis sp.]
MKFAITVSVLSLFFVSYGTESFAQTADPKVATILHCEEIYPDLEILGNTKFKQRYQYDRDLRSCISMYNDMAWYSTGPDRTQRLIAILEEQTHSKVVRDRNTESESIPKWIKDDAIRWHQGKERDSILSYGIRHMILSGMLQVPAGTVDQRHCQDEICVSKGDYITYSITGSDQDQLTVKHTIQNISDKAMIISVDGVSKHGRTSDQIQVTKDGLVQNAHAKCCAGYQFLHKVPLEIGSKINSVKDLVVESQIVFSFKGTQRPSFVAKDGSGSYYEIVDAGTGIVLFAKNHDRIKKETVTTELTDTNVLSEDLKIQYGGMKIPSWFRTPVKWWSEGQISDAEYLSGISYLLKNSILRI